MKSTITLLLLCSYLIIGTELSAQNILQLTEIPGTTKAKTIPLPDQGIPYIDINSQISIRLNKAALRDKAATLQQEKPDTEGLEAKAAEFQAALESQNEILTLLNDEAGKVENSEQLLGLLQGMFLKILTGNLTNARAAVNKYNQEYSAQIDTWINQGQTPPDRFAYIIGKLNEELETTASEIASLQAQSKANFSLVAFKRDKSGGEQIHIENFDQIAGKEFRPIQRWVIGLSGQDQQQLQNLQAAATAVNAQSENTFETIKQVVRQNLPSVECTRQLASQFNQGLDSLKADVKLNFENKKQQLLEITNLAEVVNQDITQWSVQTPFNALSGIRDFVGKVKGFRANLDTGLKQFLAGDEAAPGPFLEVSGCLTQLETDFNQVMQIAEKAGFVQNVYLSTDRIAKETLSFDLDELPEEGFIDLNYSGRREEGDELEVRAIVRFGEIDSGEEEQPRPILLEKRRMRMILVGAHAVTKLGIILGKPLNYSLPATAKQKFLFSPSASLLLKFGSRNSSFYNNFLNAGIGINTAAPDFNLDGVPEFSAGLAGSVFQDILSVGWNWNFGENAPMYFIGIHLPFQLPGLPVNTINVADSDLGQ
ncbi:MAG: hypothetical protein KDD02_26330 [Phaeodactylibacter sp.]|nr:hypothetical protein [Phaeodactylibacter sp.]MCB9303592.1 hypothetical protein [Lewinellaceae bacterium]